MAGGVGDDQEPFRGSGPSWLRTAPGCVVVLTVAAACFGVFADVGLVILYLLNRR